MFNCQMTLAVITDGFTLSRQKISELTYYPVQEPGTRLLEPGYPDLVVTVRARVRHKIFG